jgi:iron complex transport system substrate-binding protein
MAPNLTETLFALGLGERVVGVDDYSTWPAEVRSLPRLGGVMDPNLEAIVALRPDLALLAPGEQELGSRLERLGVGTLYLANDSLADVARTFTVVADRCGVPEEGRRLLADWQRGLAPRPVPGAPKVLVSIGRRPGRLTDVLVAGPGTFYDDLLGRLGAVNVFADAPTRYPQINLEEVVTRRPDVILELRSDALPPGPAAALTGDWARLPGLPAVRDGRISVITGDYVVTPGPRLPLLYREMREALLRGRTPP